MTSEESVLSDIRNELSTLGNMEVAKHSAGFFKAVKGGYGEGDLFYGIRVTVLRKLVKKYRGVSLYVVSQLLNASYHEERLLSLLILVNLFKSGDRDRRERIYNLYMDNIAYVNNWDLVDSSAEHIAGAWLAEIDNKEPLYNLAASDSCWERRISIISTFYFIKHKDFSDSLKISRMLLDDREDLVQKAVGWMLREIGKRDIDIEREFIKKHCKKMPRTMLRYAIERFPKEERQKILKVDSRL